MLSHQGPCLSLSTPGVHLDRFAIIAESAATFQGSADDVNNTKGAAMTILKGTSLPLFPKIAIHTSFTHVAHNLRELRYSRYFPFLASPFSIAYAALLFSPSSGYHGI